MLNLCYKLKRFLVKDNYQYGFIYRIGDQNPISFTCENGLNDKFIQRGIYEIKFRKVESNLTKIYRGKYNWFTWHLELQNVPNGNYVYWHIGNTQKDTDLCILSADTCDLTPPTNDGFIGESKDNFKNIYLRISEQLNNGGQCYIEIE